MNNKETKTCGECKHYDFVGQCNYVYEFNNIHANDKACEYFEPKIITNGDRIRQMSDEELAEKLVCSSYIKKKLPLYNMKKQLIGYKTVLHQVWKSSITDETYSKKSEAIAATIKELKKEWK